MPRTPPSASESCLRTTSSTVWVVAPVTSRPPRPSPGTSPGSQAVAGVVHDALVVLEADTPLAPDGSTWRDAPDAPASEPHDADRTGSVVQLCLECRHAAAR